MFVRGLLNATILSFSSGCRLNYCTTPITSALPRHISNLPQARGWEKRIGEGPPCVVLATPGMLQVGPSRELLELWAPDPRNGLVITGYSVEGTLARVSLQIRLHIGCRLDVHSRQYMCLFSPHPE